MKPVSVGRILSYVAVFGTGLGVARLVVQRDGGAVTAGGDSRDRRSPSTEGLEANRAGAAAFDGTLPGLLRLAKETRPLPRAQATLYLVLEPLPPVKIAELTKSFPQTGERSGYEKAVLTVLLQQWAAKDAAGALKWAAGLPKAGSGPARLEILRTLADTDADKAVKLTNASVPAGERAEAFAALAVVIAQTDPEKALRLLPSAFQGRNNASLSVIFKSWARRDPEKAWSKALSLPRSDRYSACEAVLRVRVGEDPGAALAMAQAMKKDMRAWATSQVFLNWPPGDTAGARAATLTLPAGRERNTAQQLVIYARAATDAPGALLEAQAMPKGTERDILVRQIFETWGASDPAAAAAALIASPASIGKKSEWVAQIASNWSSKDPAAAVEWARGLSLRDGQSNALSTALYNLSASDPNAAAAVWKSLPKDQQRGHLYALMNNWAQADTGAAMAFARSLENPADRAAALACCAGPVCAQQPEALGALLNELPAGPLRTNTIRGIIGSGYDSFSTELPSWLRELPEADRTSVMRTAFTDISEFKNPGDMKALLADTPGLSDQSRLWETTAKGLAHEDPVSAFAWAQAIESPAVRRNSMNAVLQEWARDNPAAALAQAHSLTDADMQKTAVRGVIQAWAGTDAQGVLAWAAGADGEERNFALLQGSLSSATGDPAGSAKVISELLATGGEGGAATPQVAYGAAEVARAWFGESLPESTRWAAQLPEGDARSSAVAAIVEGWTGLDPVAASEWVKQLPAGGSRDAAAFALSNGISESDPASAFAWASSIADPGKRDDALRNVATTWSTQDKTAARTAVLAAPLSDTVRASVLESIDKQE